MSDQRYGPSPVEAARKAVESGQRAAAEIFGEAAPTLPDDNWMSMAHKAFEELQAENARLKAELQQKDAAIVTVQGKVLSEVMIGVAEGRVRWDMQVHVERPVEQPEPKDFEERVLRAGKAMWDAGVTVNMADPSSFEEAKEQFCKVARYVLEEANTCAPSKEGLRRKEDAALRDDTIRSVFAWITVNARIDPVDAYTHYIRDMAGREAASGLLDKEIEDHG